VARWRFLIVLGCMALLLFAGLAAFMQRLERRAVAGGIVDDQLTAAGSPRPLAEVASILRRAKLVTTEINTRVSSVVSDQSWRGDVAATVEAPVRLLYGCDLSRMDVSAVAFSPLTEAYLVRIPAPERIATEVRTEEGLDVDVGWMRLRSRAGEYYLGLARRSLYERARELTLSPEDAQTVRENTLEQVRAVLGRVLGDGARVQVMFVDGGGP
jgi:hypothetical protein